MGVIDCAAGLSGVASFHHVQVLPFDGNIACTRISGQRNGALTGKATLCSRSSSRRFDNFWRNVALWFSGWPDGRRSDSFPRSGDYQYSPGNNRFGPDSLRVSARFQLTHVRQSQDVSSAARVAATREVPANQSVWLKDIIIIYSWRLRGGRQPFCLEKSD